MSPSVRKRRDEDLASLAELLLAVHEEDGYPSNFPEDPVAWLASARTLEALVAEEEGELLGHVALASPTGDFAEETWRASLGAPEESIAVIKRLYVAPSARRRGLGRLLLSAAVALAHRRGERPVLDVDAKAAAANRLYQEEGFASVGELELVWSTGGPPFVARCYIGPPPPSRTDH